MFPTFFILNRHLGKKLDRENLKRKLINNQDITSNLTNLIIESDNYITNDAPNDTTSLADNHSLHHAQDHLPNINDPDQKDATIRALDE